MVLNKFEADGTARAHVFGMHAVVASVGLAVFQQAYRFPPETAVFMALH